MKRFRITLMVPRTTEVAVADAQAAHNEATRLASAPQNGGLKASVLSIEEIEGVVTELIDFGDDAA